MFVPIWQGLKDAFLYENIELLINFYMVLHTTLEQIFQWLDCLSSHVCHPKNVYLSKSCQMVRKVQRINSRLLLFLSIIWDFLSPFPAMRFVNSYGKPYFLKRFEFFFVH